MFDVNTRFRRYSLAESAVALGVAFRMFDEVTIPAASSVMWSVTIPNDKARVLFSRLISSNQPNIRYEVYGAATGAAYGSAVPIYNMNSVSSKASTVLFRRLTAGAPSGPLRDLDIARGAEGTGVHGTGETFSSGDIRVFPPGAEVFIRVVNPNPEEAAFLVYLKYFEANTAMFADAP